jgi:hypothetical protein
MITSEKIIDSLQKLMCSAITTAVDAKVANNDYFKRRILGFKAEIEFEKFINEKFEKKIEFLEGGQFISKKISGQKDDKNSFIYTTIDNRDPEKYIEIYKQISEWNEVKNLYFIKLNENDWGEEPFIAKDNDKKEIKTNILKPKFNFYIFQKDQFIISKVQDFKIILENFEKPERRPNIYKLRGDEKFKYFLEYENTTLKKIYATRYFLDHIMRQARGRQILDLDGFIIKNKKIILVEIKEKTPNKNKKLNEEIHWQYGWDSRRLLWYLYLLKKINFTILYNVRQIEEREERKFLQWDSIWINDFLNGVSWSFSRSGGGGEDTLSAPYSYFKNLKTILEEI